MRVSPILISNRGVLPLNKTSNVKKCYLQDEPTKPECPPCSFKAKGVGPFTIFGATLCTAFGPVGTLLGGYIGKVIDNSLDKPRPTDNSPELTRDDDWMHLRDVAY